MIGYLGTTPLACFSALPQDGLVQFAGDGIGDFRILRKKGDSGQFRASVDEVQKKFDIEGSPVLQRNRSGFQLSCHHLFGSYVIEHDGKFRLDAVHAHGSALATFDSDRARTFAKANSLAYTAEPGVLTTLNSDNIDASEKDKIQTLTLRQPYRLADSRPGITKEGAFTRSTTFEGSSGVFTFSIPDQPGKAKLLTGDSNGPVHLHSSQIVLQRRTVFMLGKIVPFIVKVERVLDATGDHLSADMSKTENQLVLTGHVHAFYSVAGSTMDSDRLTATVDQDGNVVGVDANDTPTRDGAPAKGGGQ